MGQVLSIIANLATIATFIIACLTIDKVKKIEKIICVDIDQSSGKGTASRTEVRQEITGNRNIQSGRDTNV